MTYEVLEKVSKKDLIRWMRNNVYLPNISDKKFLREIRLERLFAVEKELLEKEKKLNKQLEANTENTFAFMAILIESQKNDEEIKKVNIELDKLLNWRRK